MLIARQSTARTVTVGPVLDASGVAVTDGVVGDFKIAKNGGAPAALNGSATATHRHTGFYSLALTASDLDTVGTAEITIDDTTNSMALKEVSVVEEAVYDALFAASANAFTGAAGASQLTALASGAITEASFATTAGSFAPLGIIDQGTAQSATATGLVLRAAAAFADNVLKNCIVWVYGSDQGYWQAPRIITANALTGDSVTVDPAWEVTPTGTIAYKIFAAPADLTTLPTVNVTQWLGVAPNALVSGRVDGTVGAMQANVITAAAAASDFGAEVADAVLDEALAGHATAGTLGAAVTDILADTGTTLQAELDDIEADINTLLTRIGVPGTSIAAELAGLNDISAADVWAAGTRTLTAGTNIALAKGTGVTGFNDLSAAQVNAEVADVVATDTYGEPSQGAPGATLSLAAKINWLYASWRNRKTNDGTTTNLYADDGSTVLARQTVGSSGGTVSKAEWISGA